MKKYRFRTFHSVSFRLIALFLCALVPLQVFGVILFSNGYKTIANQIGNISASTLTALSENIEKEINIVFSDLYEIEDNATLKQVTSPLNQLDAADYYMSLMKVRNYLETIRDNNPWIQEIRIYITHSNSFLSVIGEHDNTLWGKYRHTVYEQSELDTLLESTRSIGSNSLIWDENGPYVSILYPENTYFSGKRPNFVIQIRLSETEIRSALSAGSAREHESMAILDLSSGRVLIGSGAELNADAFAVLYEEICGEEMPYTGSFSYNDVDYFATACAQEKRGLIFMQLTPREIALQSLRHYEMGLVGFVLVSLVMFVICSWLSLRTIRNPILKLVGGFEEIEAGNYDVQLPLVENADELTYLTSGFNHMSTKLSDTINRLYKQEIYTQRMELSQLQMQINPHFLFNSYFMMDRLLKQGEYEVAEELSNCLGEYFRYINRDARRYVELSMEWNHMCSYAKVQQLRYRRRIELNIEPVPEKYRDYIVPRLILQPLVENSLEHGLAHMKEGGVAKLSFVYDVEFLRVIVEDNGREATNELISSLKERLSGYDAPNQETSALINIHRRLQLYFGPQYGVELSRSELNGLRAEIIMPSMERRDMDADTERADRG